MSAAAGTPCWEVGTTAIQCWSEHRTRDSWWFTYHDDRRLVLIDYDTKNWFQHIAYFHKSDTLRLLLPEMILVALGTGLIAYLAIDVFQIADAAALRDSTVLHSILGFILSLLLVFRTNTAYDRWWEGRKQWGALVNHSRSLAIKVFTLIPATESDTRESLRLAIADFPFALKEHLRKGVIAEELRSPEFRSLSEMQGGGVHVPNRIVRSMYAQLKRLVDQQVLSGEEWIMLDKQLVALVDILGACERIRKTPIPFTYNIFLKKFIFFYIVTLPVGFISYFQYWAIPISVFVFYVLVSLEVIAEEIENPFGRDPNDLPLDRLSDTIRANVDEIFDRPDSV